MKKLMLLIVICLSAYIVLCSVFYYINYGHFDCVDFLSRVLYNKAVGTFLTIQFLPMAGFLCLKYCKLNSVRVCKFRLAAVTRNLYEGRYRRIFIICVLSAFVITSYTELIDSTFDVFSSPLLFILYTYFFYSVFKKNKLCRWLTSKIVLARLLVYSMMLLGGYIICELFIGVDFIIFWEMIMYFVLLGIPLTLSFKKHIVTTVLGIIIYSLFWFCMWYGMMYSFQPFAWVMQIALFAALPCWLLRKIPKYIWTICFILLLWGCYYEYFNGSVAGQLTWSIHDTPIDYPGQWFDSYNFYRIMTYIKDVVTYSGSWAIFIAIIYKTSIALITYMKGDEDD